MSQIALGYVVPFANVPKLVAALKEPNTKAFWQEIAQSGKAVEPAYPFSGHVLSVLLAQWEEHDIQMPLSVEQAPLGELLLADVGLAVCASKSDAVELLKPLKEPMSLDNLRDYFNEFTAQDFDEAGIAMQSGWDYVVRGLESLESDDHYYLLFIA